MTIQHKDAPDGKRHEPKGASTAASGTVYVSDGAGSGNWTNQLATIKNRNLVTLCGTFSDISTAASIFIPNPIAGVISKIYVSLDAGITTANSLVTAELNGVLVSGSTVTVTAGSAAGATFSSTPSGSNAVAAGQAIEIITDGGSTGSAPAHVTVVVDVT